MNRGETQKHLELVLRERNNLIAEAANLRTQLLQMQTVAEYLETHFYKPMLKGFWNRLWYAAWIKKTHRMKGQ